ncbi:hypothetical protein ACFL41_00430 [Gemmatimonadota bacterium]
MDTSHSSIRSLIGLLAVFLGATTVASCDSLLSVREDDDPLIYRSSFETLVSVWAWKGVNGVERSNGACPGGGAYSGYVSGGCEGPHAYLDLPPSKRDRHLIIRFWAKVLELQGHLEFAALNTDQHIWITVNDTTWTHYPASDTLFCPANRTLRITMGSGGIEPGAMLVDLMEVETVDVK